MSNQFELAMKLLLNNAGARESIKQIGRDMKTAAQNTKAEWTEVSKVITNKLALIGFGAGVGKLMYDSASLSNSLNKMQVITGASAEQIKKLRNNIWDLAQSTGEPVNELVNQFNNLKKSMTWEEAAASFSPLSEALDLTDANAANVSTSLARIKSAFKIDMTKGQNVADVLDKLIVAGRDRGGLDVIAGVVATIANQASIVGLNFDKTTAFVRELYGIEADPGRLVANLDSIFKIFSKPTIYNLIKRQGIKIFDADGSRRDIIAVLSEIKDRYNKLPTELAKTNFLNKILPLRDEETKRALKVIFGSDVLKSTSTYMGTLAEAPGSLTKMKDDLERTDAKEQAAKARAALLRVTDEMSVPINKALAKGLDYLTNKDTGLGLNGEQLLVGGAVTSLVSSFIGGKVGGALGGLLAKAGVLTGIIEGKAIQQTAGVDPVYVVNAAEIGNSFGGSGGGNLGRQRGSVKGLVTAAALILGDLYAVYQINQRNIADALEVQRAKKAGSPSVENKMWQVRKLDEGDVWSVMMANENVMADYARNQQLEYDRNKGISPQIESNITIVLPQTGTVVTKSDSGQKVNARVVVDPMAVH